MTAAHRHAQTVLNILVVVVVAVFCVVLLQVPAENRATVLIAAGSPLLAMIAICYAALRSVDPSSAAKPLDAKLDEWADTIKEKLLDWEVLSPENEHAESEGEDVPLAPLDREQFAERFGAKVNEVYGYITEHVAGAKTDYDLLRVESAIHPLLSTLRWEAIATALELRQPDGGPVSIDEVRAIAESLEPAESRGGPAKPTGDWVSKYRRMRAAGI